ncbi:FADH2 O2-dependent halogenase [Cyclonatronum proteinivorum]|uniref:FADH2 O2-dependent halogenase n=1 Tax=Cyclonatronum proteinivorum TaxID=1457365 RepID=A0A345ULT3_9BACT|nr:tryptophan 7-halogenase [Cyclonatronum proteinivorum]AXJ01435.1 FADH2 O2-dependent halogenase [Cyclonatronum proteinivorum]
MRRKKQLFENIPAHAGIVVAGAGFGGSLLSIILKQQGHDVLLLERSTHPRFTIGESSTPIADMILRDLAQTYGLEWLTPLSRYGSWKESYPELRVGLKRGFSYYFHEPDKPFSDDTRHARSLLVAASNSDESSDTQWYRPDFDAFLVQKAVEEGVAYYDQTEITRVLDNGPGHPWYLSLRSGKRTHELSADFIIDATGADQLSRLLGVKPADYAFHTSSAAVFSHVTNVPEWHSYLQEQGISGTDTYPFHPDHAALHHLIDEGWLWMLRFSDGLLSAGFMLSWEDQKQLVRKSNHKLVQHLFQQYPSLNALFDGAEIAQLPGKWLKTKPLQRMSQNAAGSGFALLPHSAGFVDPMHSTGIAITLCAIEKLALLFREAKPGETVNSYALDAYSISIMRELQLIDVLVAGCYKTRRNPDLFEAWLSCYFTCSISYEQARLKGERPASFLNAMEQPVSSMIYEAWEHLLQLEKEGFPDAACHAFIEAMRRRIQPWNIAGLLTPNQKMYAHTAVDL